jgi:hypothetical protein
MIDNRNLPILGINSDPIRRTGALLNAKIKYEERDKQIPLLLEDLLAN